MSNILYHRPGEPVSIFLQTDNIFGVKADGYSLPIVKNIILPDLTDGYSDGYLFPQNMIKIDIGLYYFKFIPLNILAGGSYLVDVLYTTPENFPKSKIYNIFVQPITTNPSAG